MKLGLAARLGAALFSVALSACVTPAVPQCELELVAKPPLSAECRARPESESYLQDAGERFSALLDRDEAHPGRLELSVAYGADARVESACVRLSDGKIVHERAPRAVSRLLAADSAPDCFAGRRVELKWESALVTDVEYRRVKAKCSASGRWDPRARALDFCLSMSTCRPEDFASLEDTGTDAEVMCMLRYLPVSFGWVGNDQLLTFLPRADQSPGRREALSASTDCEHSPDRAGLVACMHARGWEPIDWEGRRRSIMGPDFD